MAAKEIQVRKWVFSDPKKNSNKFWNVHVYDNGTWRAHYGRVGSAGSWASAKSTSALSKKIQEKQRKGYKEIVQATASDEHVIMTPVGAIPLEQIKKAFTISEKIVNLPYTSGEAQKLYPKYMQLLPINIGMRSDSWNIHRQIRIRHGKLDEIIKTAEDNSSSDLFKSLLDEFFAEFDD